MVLLIAIVSMAWHLLILTVFVHIHCNILVKVRREAIILDEKIKDQCDIKDFFVSLLVETLKGLEQASSLSRYLAMFFLHLSVVFFSE